VLLGLTLLQLLYNSTAGACFGCKLPESGTMTTPEASNFYKVLFCPKWSIAQTSKKSQSFLVKESKMHAIVLLKFVVDQ